MTNKAWLFSLSKSEFAMWLVCHTMPCEYCEYTKSCDIINALECTGNGIAWQKWLDAEHNE